MSTLRFGAAFFVFSINTGGKNVVRREGCLCPPVWWSFFPPSSIIKLKAGSGYAMVSTVLSALPPKPHRFELRCASSKCMFLNWMWGAEVGRKFNSKNVDMVGIVGNSARMQTLAHRCRSLSES